MDWVEDSLGFWKFEIWIFWVEFGWFWIGVVFNDFFRKESMDIRNKSRHSTVTESDEVRN